MKNHNYSERFKPDIINSEKWYALLVKVWTKLRNYDDSVSRGTYEKYYALFSLMWRLGIEPKMREKS